MPIDRVDPETLSTPSMYAQVVTTTASRLVFVAGQVAQDREGNLVGADDLGEQARQVYRNVRAALEAVGARPEDVVKVTTLVVDHRPELLPLIAEARSEVLGPIRPASTLIGVQALARPEFLIEVEAVAVLDAG